MTARRPEKPDRPVQDRTPKNILERPLRLSPMRNIKDEVGDDCTCREPVSFHHSDGTVICVRCGGRVEEGEE